MRADHLYIAMIVTSLTAMAWSQPGDRRPATAGNVSVLSSGIAIQSGKLHEEITALRDDVLRVRLWRGDRAPEDASWAVLPTARHASVPVTTMKSMGGYGFRTRKLTVVVNTRTLEVTVRNLAGDILQQDARPIEFNGIAFRIYKMMPPDEHYFGLGDKAGPLDRRNEAFTLWNTDAYRYQESTDPLYKSIPYFMAFRAGSAVGVLFDNT